MPYLNICLSNVYTVVRISVINKMSQPITRGKSKQMLGNSEEQKHTTKYPPFPKLNLKNSCRTNTSYEIVISPSTKSTSYSQPSLEEEELESIKHKLRQTELSNENLLDKIRTLQEALDKYRANITKNELIIDQLKSELSRKTQKTLSEVHTQTDAATVESVETQTDLPLPTSACDNAPPTLEVRNTKDKPLGHPKVSGRVLLLADSHGRGAADILKEKLKRFEVSSIFKPNAMFNEVVQDLRALTADFDKQDYVIVMAGINDILSFHQITRKKLENVLRILTHTNIVFVSIPYWPGRRVLNNIIYQANSNIYNEIMAASPGHTVFFVDVNYLIDFTHMTRSGLHLRFSGKHLVFNYISDIINFNCSTVHVCNDNLIYLTKSDNTPSSQTTGKDRSSFLCERQFSNCSI